MTTGTIDNDVQDNIFAGADDINVDDAAEAFLKRWDKDKSKTSSETDEKKEGASPKAKETEAKEDEEHSEEETDAQHKTDHEDAEEQPEEGEETEEKEERSEKQLASDENEVEITVDGETRRVPVKDLKRLFGQEAALTRKSQEVADQRKAVESQATVYQTGLQKMLERAEERFKPFAGIDWLLAAKNLSSEDLGQLRNAAKAAADDVKFLKEELNTHVQTENQKQFEKLRSAATECVKVLTDPEKGIKGWDEKMYDDLRTYAVDHGMSVESYNRLVDPAAFKLLHKAYEYDKAQKVAVKKVVTAPKNIAKTKSSNSGRDASKAARDNAMKKLRESGDVEDASNAFLARWGVD